MQDIIVSGSIAYDYLMRFPGQFKEHIIADQLDHVSLSFLVEDMTKHWGGVAANIAYTMALLGAQPKLFGTVGRDFGDYEDHLKAVGVDCNLVRQHDEVFTASFFANTDLDNNQIASFYSGAMALSKNYLVADVYDGFPDLVVISPSDPEAMLRLSEECRERGIKFVADPSQQVPRLDGEQLRQCVSGAYLITVNEYEADIICKKTGLDMHGLRDLVDILIVTEGAKGATIYLNGEQKQIGVFPPDEILDPTGVGDAFRGGLLRGIQLNLPIEVAAEMGATCATYALEKVGTQNHRFTPQSFVERFRTQFDDHGVLDALL
ncbi:MAG: carbohydrate kinase family protein [Chloroflexota bacterium]